MTRDAADSAPAEAARPFTVPAGAAPALIAGVTVETVINGPREAVWRSLTEHIQAWWPENFYVGGESGKRRFVLEDQIGGRMYEEWGDGGGLLWGTVCTLRPGELLQIVGHTFPDWGGPSQWYGTLTLEPADGGVRVRFSESAVGQVDPKRLRGNQKGWDFLFCRALKAHVEGAPAPAWVD
ncbi:MAG: SRPBCC domain-containing protein [Acidobacteriota bacterium]